LFSALSVQSGYKEDFSSEEFFEFRDATLPGHDPGAEGLSCVGG
jgi:hypothetical protein